MDFVIIGEGIGEDFNEVIVLETKKKEASDWD